jgi:hypothetical protein
MSLEEMELKFIGRVTTMGQDRLVIVIPKSHLKPAILLNGKYVKVYLQEIEL